MDIKIAWRFLGCSLMDCRGRGHQPRYQEVLIQSQKIKDSWKQHTTQRVMLSILLFLLTVLVPIIPVIAFHRDIGFVFEGKDCSSLTPCTLATAVVLMKQMLTLCNMLADVIIKLFITGLVWSYVSEWDSLTDVIEMEDIVTSGLRNTDISERKDVIYSLIRNEHYFFHSIYHNAGKNTENTRKALESWFAMHYFVFLLYTFISAMHVLRPTFNNEDIKDKCEIILYTLFILYNLISLLVPSTGHMDDRCPQKLLQRAS